MHRTKPIIAVAFLVTHILSSWQGEGVCQMPIIWFARGETMIAMFSIIPMDKGESISAEVAKAIRLVDESGLNYQTTAMGTLVEGDWESIMDLIKKCHQAVRRGSKRVYTRINIDDREGATNELAKKVASVESKLGKPVHRVPGTSK